MKYSKAIFSIVLTFILLIFIFNFLEYKNYKNELLKNKEESYNNCLNVNNQICKNIIKEREEYIFCKNNNSKECKIIKNNYNLIKNNNETFLELTSTEVSVYTFIMYFLLIFSWTFITTYYFSSLTIKNYLNRISYNKYIKKIYSYNLRYIIYPILFILLLIINTIMITNSFDLSFINIRFILLYLINPLLQSIFLINISFIFSLGSKNNIISFVKTSAFYIITILLVGSFKFYYNSVKISDINMLELISLSDINNLKLITITVIKIVLVILSSLALYIIFKNKERVITIMEGENL